MVADRIDVKGARVLDLACRAGAFTVAFARAGATVLGLEGRAENLAMAEHVPGATYAQGDVRDLSPEVHGIFDVVLCLGILYHLDADDAVQLLRSMRDCTKRGGLTIIDTHAGVPAASVVVDGQSYAGSWFAEPAVGNGWSSMGNLRSFWFTPESLADACRAAGWSAVEVLPGVRWPGEPGGRHWLALS